MNEEKIIQDCLGVPFRHGGRDPKGWDCWGMVKWVYQTNKGATLFDLDNYTPEWKAEGKNLLIENYHKDWQKVSDPKPLDVILFRMRNGLVSHCGILLSHNRCLHCLSVAGTIISNLNTGALQKRIEGYYRLKG